VSCPFSSIVFRTCLGLRDVSDWDKAADPGRPDGKFRAHWGAERLVRCPQNDDAAVRRDQRWRSVLRRRTCLFLPRVPFSSRFRKFQVRLQPRLPHRDQAGPRWLPTEVSARLAVRWGQAGRLGLGFLQRWTDLFDDPRPRRPLTRDLGKAIRSLLEQPLFSL
jgi:hypothetical protein